MTVEEFLRALDERAHSDALATQAEQQTAQIVEAVNRLAAIMQPKSEDQQEHPL